MACGCVDEMGESCEYCKPKSSTGNIGVKIPVETEVSKIKTELERRNREARNKRLGL